MGFNNYPSLLAVGGAQYSYYATLNPADKTDALTILYGGNLSVRVSAGSRLVRATINVSSGSADPLVYWEVYINTTSLGGEVGVSVNGLSYSTSLGADPDGWAFQTYLATPFKYHNGSQVSYGSAFAMGDTVMVALDMTNGFIYFGKNGTWLNGGVPTSGVVGTGAAYSGLTGNVYPTFGNYSGNGYDYTACFDPASFTYSPPAGYSALHH